MSRHQPSYSMMLETLFARRLNEDLENRVLDFDSAAATEAALLAASRQKSWRPVDVRDTQIAGIVIARRATFATRNLWHLRISIRFDGV
jgi:predicted nucleic acid-binding protein